MKFCLFLCLVYFLQKHNFSDQPLKPDTSELSGSIKVLLSDVIITVQSILCSVTPLFSGLPFLWSTFDLVAYYA